MMTFLSNNKTKPITIRLPVEILEEYKKKAEDAGVATSKLLADACVSWWMTAKHMEVQQEPEVKELEGRKWIKVEGEAVHLTDPYSYKPHIFVDDE